MAYNKKTWISNEIISKNALNNIENGIENLDGRLEDLEGRLEDLEGKEVEVDLSSYQEKTDNDLATKSKDIVGAINELFQSANNGKQLIANAIGEPLSSNDTFSAMSDKINDIKSDLKQVLTDEGVATTDSDTMGDLIVKVDEEFAKKNANQGIKIDCVGTLPTTSVENQIVVITPNVPSAMEIKDYTNCTPTSNGQIIIGASTTKNSNSMVPYSITTNGVALTLYLDIAKGKFNDKLEVYDGYVRRDDEWLQFSVGRNILYSNGYDAIGFTNTNNWSLSSNMFISSTSPTIEFKMQAYNGGWLDEYAYFKDSIDLTNVRQVRIVGSYTDNGGNTSAGVGFVTSSSFGMTYPTWSKEINLTDSVKEVITDVSKLTGNYYFGTVNRSAPSVKNALKITEFELIY
jgi:hypothetical protein